MTRKRPVVQVEKRHRAPRTMAHVLRASDARAEAVAAARPWRIVDILQGGRPYIPKDFPSHDAASIALSDLLAPYPCGDPWRRRLRLAPALTELRDHLAGREGGKASNARRAALRAAARAVPCSEASCDGWALCAGLCRPCYDSSRRDMRKAKARRA